MGFLYGLVLVFSVFMIAAAFGKSRDKGLAALSLSYHLLLFNAAYALYKLTTVLGGGSSDTSYLYAFSATSGQLIGLIRFSLAGGLLLFAVHALCKSLKES
ncbi:MULTISPECIES: hypothetical protein [unclassified Paenibacillus]|uniref:hypothetical protein n=1 Tax=unclassified Paenibacillus TaxID=185978 RepID=UPI00040437B9|nr:MULTISPECIES: hypothetical protein [unclassified Paenibacillus]